MTNKTDSNDNKPQRVVASGTLNLGGGAHECFVLEDGTPVLGTAQIQAILGASGNRQLSRSVSRIPNENGGLVVRPRVMILPAGASSTRANGYAGEDVIDICIAYSNAFVAGSLKPQQMHIAMRAIAVLNATAKTGIRALVYEATGFKSTVSLQEHYARNLRDELAEWSQCFGTDWDQAFCRLYSLPYDGVPPRWMGAVNDKFYRTVLGSQLVNELKRRNPTPQKGSNHHQLLKDRAKGVVEQHIPTFRAIALTSTTPKDFWHKIAVVFDRAPLQMNLDIDVDGAAE
jgi:hypothetical protein